MFAFEWSMVSAIAATVIALITAGGAIARFVWTYIVRPFLQDEIADVVKETNELAQETNKLVIHHLGPNGNTPPLWKRVAVVEQAIQK